MCQVEYICRMGVTRSNSTKRIRRAGVSRAGAAPRRRPEEGGYARGEETRARIVASAMAVFGEQGYDRASTRQIAANAGVNPPALQYYFDSKEGLYRACVQAIVDRVREVLAPAMQRAQAAISARAQPLALEALLNLLDALTDALVAAGAQSWSRFIERGTAGGTGPAMTRLRERVSKPLRQTICELIGVVRDQPAQAEQTRLRALTLMGQVSVFHANRESTLAALGWQQFDPPALAAMKAIVRANTRAALAAPEPSIGALPLTAAKGRRR